MIIVGSIVFLTALFYVFPFIRVVGDSMFPTYIDGQLLPSMRVARFVPLYDGRVYVFRSPDGKTVIKRLAYHDKRKCYFLGDNATVSYDSRAYGYVDRRNIVAVVL